MSLSTFVKVGEITNLSDARYCAGMGVDLLGFNVVENTGTYVDPQKFEEIVSWVVGVSYCAELGGHQPGSDLIASLRNAGISYVESTSEAVLRDLDGFQKIFKYKVNEDSLPDLEGLLNTVGGFTDMLLLECADLQLAASIDELVEKSGGDFPVLKAYSLTPETVTDLTEKGFHGIALKGSEEIKPGYKDFDELAEILEALEVD